MFGLDQRTWMCMCLVGISLFIAVCQESSARPASSSALSDAMGPDDAEAGSPASVTLAPKVNANNIDDKKMSMTTTTGKPKTNESSIAKDDYYAYDYDDEDDDDDGTDSSDDNNLSTKAPLSTMKPSMAPVGTSTLKPNSTSKPGSTKKPGSTTRGPILLSTTKKSSHHHHIHVHKKKEGEPRSGLDSPKTTTLSPSAGESSSESSTSSNTTTTTTTSSSSNSDGVAASAAASAAEGGSRASLDKPSPSFLAGPTKARTRAPTSEATNAHEDDPESSDDYSDEGEYRTTPCPADKLSSGSSKRPATTSRPTTKLPTSKPTTTRLPPVIHITTPKATTKPPALTSTTTKPPNSKGPITIRPLTLATSNPK